MHIFSRASRPYTLLTTLAALLGAAPVTAAGAQAARHHLVIDTDVGPDDLMAIAFLLGRSDVQIDAIITEMGVAHVGPGAQNVLRLLHLAGADRIPVYTGVAAHVQPTVSFPASWMSQSEQQGADAAPATNRKPATGDAVSFLADRLRHPLPNEEILALGPLTNLALAIRRAGAANVKPIRTVIMGGAVDAPGNLVTPDTKTDNTRAEWNIYSDPLAASEVLASPLHVELVPLDATRFVQLDTCFIDALNAGGSQPLRHYVGQILEGTRDWVVRGDYYAWDPLAAVSVVDPGVLKFATIALVVDLTGPFVGSTRRSAQGHPVVVATAADRRRFMQLFDAALGPRKSGGLLGCK